MIFANFQFRHRADCKARFFNRQSHAKKTDNSKSHAIIFIRFRNCYIGSAIYQFKKFSKGEFMNKLTAKARITEVDGLSDSIIRIFGADTKAQEPS